MVWEMLAFMRIKNDMTMCEIGDTFIYPRVFSIKETMNNVCPKISFLLNIVNVRIE